MEDVCSYRHVWAIDNFLRRWIHNPAKIYSPWLKPGMTVIDIGCGGGFTAIGMARIVGDRGHVLCVDLQREMLDIAKRKADKAGLGDRIHTHQCTPDSLGVEESFDFANTFWMVHEVPDKPAFFRQVRACLKPGGRLFVAEPRMHVTRDAFEHMIETAAQAGLSLHARPPVRLSMAAVFSRE